LSGNNRTFEFLRQSKEKLLAKLG